jgi:parvulin-like peptidyl-prolyl isomerase
VNNSIILKQDTDRTDGTSIDAAELGFYRLWKALLRARLLDEASSGFTPEPEDVESAWQDFCKKFKVDQVTSLPVPPDYIGCPAERLKSAIERECRISLWKKKLFEPQAAERFEARKPALDRVVYSLLRVKDAGLARELWFRIKEGEATFADLAPNYASGNEVYTAGIVGPVAFGAMHPALAGVLKPAPVGEVLRPFAVAEWYLVARVDHHLPVEFDDAMKAQMVDELVHIWLEERCHGRPTA